MGAGERGNGGVWRDGDQGADGRKRKRGGIEVLTAKRKMKMGASEPSSVTTACFWKSAQPAYITPAAAPNTNDGSSATVVVAAIAGRLAAVTRVGGGGGGGGVLFLVVPSVV